MHLLIRADASVHIGTGHVMRCLALAQAWMQQGGQAIALMTKTTSALESRLTSESVQVLHLESVAGSQKDARETVQIAQRVGAIWVVVDGYQFSAEYQRILKENGLQLLVLDDYGHAEHYWADIVLNQNISADISLYPNREPYTQLLLGPRFALLRQEFWDWQGWQRQIPAIARKILVTLGGSDPDNVTLKVIQALQQVQIDDLQVVAVVGASNPHFEALLKAVESSQHSIRLERNVTNMPKLMAWADIAISGGGSTCWELAFMGLPSLTLILAKNQQVIAEKLDAIGLAINSGWHSEISTEHLAEQISQPLSLLQLRTDMSNTSYALVDGEGSERILMYLKDKKLRLRTVRESDCKMLWHWANDPDVRASAFSSTPISWREHQQWFTHKLNIESCHIFIAIDRDDKPIGQVRFDIQDNQQAEIDISLDRAKRNLGYGNDMIEMTVKEIFSHININSVYSFIKSDNIASIKLFEKANFIRVLETVFQDKSCLHYIFKKQ
jgi:UDP-2,4-diacetamido-2,4,6-trideoxy-beta-L-altropyranose hydrolase